MIFSEAGSVGVLAVVGSGGNVTRGSKGESNGGVGQRGGAMWGGSGAGKDDGPGLKVGCNTIIT